MDDGGDLENMRDFGGKLPGAAARIVGLFHCAIHAKGSPSDQLVPAPTMRRALSLAGKFAEHTRAVYELMGADPDIEDARKVLAWIMANAEQRFSVRNLHNSLQGTFYKRDELEPSLKVLTERGYIRQTQRPDAPGRGRPSLIFEVNPSILGAS